MAAEDRFVCLDFILELDISCYIISSTKRKSSPDHDLMCLAYKSHLLCHDSFLAILANLSDPVSSVDPPLSP